MAKREPLVKDEFFEKMDELCLALTYDDIRLRSGHSKIMPEDVSLESKFSRNVPLKTPITGAAMDTVTENKLAIELAKLGGIGIIHRNFTPDEQADEVARVKYHLNGFIEKPIHVFEDETIASILRMREEKRYSFHIFPVINHDGKLVGILTENDYKFCSDNNLPAKEVMTKHVITARKGIKLEEAYERMLKEKKEVLPLVDDNNNMAGMYAFSDAKRIVTGSSKDYNLDKRGQLRVGAAVGVLGDAYSRLEKLAKENVDVIVIDTSHGDTDSVIETLKEIKKKYAHIDVVAGNISEPESAERLCKAGADGIKIGQGPGACCTTRIIAGIGCPQVTAIYNCSKVADESDVPVCADGGLKYSGDIPIAIGAGAHSVMMGSMLAGTKEAPGRLVLRDGRQWKMYRGMGSLEAMETSKSARDRYGQPDVGSKKQLVSEGVPGYVTYRGELKDVMYQYVGGLRRGMGYVGAASIEELRVKANFRRISYAGQAESHPHDMVISEEPPNYPGNQDKK